VNGCLAYPTVRKERHDDQKHINHTERHGIGKTLGDFARSMGEQQAPYNGKALMILTKHNPTTRMREKHLNGHAPASTVVCCKLLNPQWRLDVEAIAAAA
jgi:hypothetical protein